MRKLATTALVLGAAAALAALWIRHAGREPSSAVVLPRLEHGNVLLVTIDTLRADHVGAYGSTRGATPTLDGLARDGVRFETAYAHVPLTLPSHATILTGLYPPHNGVRDNGAFRLDSSVETLATRLAADGYRTGAFLGAFVLDARFGLNRGFQVYDDRMRSTGGSAEAAERRAEEVLQAAQGWILSPPSPPAAAPRASPGAAPSAPAWFAWVHLYDPHAPYDPPEPYRTRYAGDPYDGEIAYADASLGVFLAALRSAGALDRTLVVVAADHGESLGDHGERTHGLFAYDSTIRVPLILRAPDGAAGVVRDPARLVDVAPTILASVGAPPLQGADGRALLSPTAPAADAPGSYFEALNANLTRGWAPLTGIVRGGLKLIDLPVPELYDLSSDPGEARNVYAREPDRAHDLEQRLDLVVRGARPAAPAAVDADAEARLRSLGYVVASSPRPERRYTAEDDPKRLVQVNTALDEAAARWERGDRAQAIDVLRALLRDHPAFALGIDRLAFMLRANGQPREALALLDQAARGGHADRAVLRSLGGLLREAGDLKRSATVLEPLASGTPPDLQAADSLGQTYARMGRTADAEAAFKRVLAASPNAATTWNNLGALWLAAGRAADAEGALRRAIAADPDLAAAHNALGVVFARRGDPAGAAREWRTALALRPGYADARDNLARIGAK